MERETIKESTRSSAASDQRRRRKDLLARQKERRAALTALSRGPVELPVQDGSIASPVSNSDPMAFSVDALMQSPLGANSAVQMQTASTSSPSAADEPERMQTDPRRRRGSSKPNAAAALMAAEWMVDVPDDLADNWYVLARPAGKRCLVSTAGGTTTATSRGGRSWRFPSALPGGSRQLRSAGRCELDCIWSEAMQTYFVLDALSWKEQRLDGCSAEFRLYWTHAKLSESKVHEQTSSNPCRFVVSAWLKCSAEQLQHTYSAPAGYERDGLFFVHKEALYEAGPNPLLLSWSDAHCSSRFYNYGSEQMAAAVEYEPEKAARWRTDELDEAITYETLLNAVIAGAASMDT